MTEEITNVAGIEIPSANPVFLASVGVHVMLGLACVVTGAVAMLSQKRPGRHPRYGTIYFWCLAGVFLTATGLAVVRWVEDYHLLILGALSFAAAYFGRQARRRRWRSWLDCTSPAWQHLTKAVASLERASPLHLLAVASGRWCSAHRSRCVVASTGTTKEPALIALGGWAIGCWRCPVSSADIPRG